MEISVKLNKEHDELIKKNVFDGFLYYKFYLDISPQEGVKLEEYMNQLKSLINYLRSKGYKVIPSCDFEDKLNEGKPYTEWMK